MMTNIATTRTMIMRRRTIPTTARPAANETTSTPPTGLEVGRAVRTVVTDLPVGSIDDTTGISI